MTAVHAMPCDARSARVSQAYAEPQIYCVYVLLELPASVSLHYCYQYLCLVFCNDSVTTARPCVIYSKRSLKNCRVPGTCCTLQSTQTVYCRHSKRLGSAMQRCGASVESDVFTVEEHY